MKKELDKVWESIKIEGREWSRSGYKIGLKKFVDDLYRNIQSEEQEKFLLHTQYSVAQLEEINIVNSNILVYKGAFPECQQKKQEIISILRKYNYIIDDNLPQGKIKVSLSAKDFFKKPYPYNLFESNGKKSLTQIIEEEQADLKAMTPTATSSTPESKSKTEPDQSTSQEVFNQLTTLIQDKYWEGKTTRGLSTPDGIKEMRTFLDYPINFAYGLLRSAARERLQTNYCSFFVRRNPMLNKLYTALAECKDILKLSYNENFREVLRFVESAKSDLQPKGGR